MASFSVGTAWPVAGGFAVTNNHVVEGVEQVQLINVSGTQLTASVTLRNTEHDLALLRVNESGNLPPALPLASDKSASGQAMNRRVEVEFWYDDPLQELPGEPQLCPAAAGAEEVTQVYTPEWGELPRLEVGQGEVAFSIPGAPPRRSSVAIPRGGR